jgi:hypothetical protein
MENALERNGGKLNQGLIRKKSFSYEGDISLNNTVNEEQRIGKLDLFQIIFYRNAMVNDVFP